MKQVHRLSRDGPAIYQITIQGCLDERWSGWFAGLTIHCQGNGTTQLSGPITDQPALYGILKRIRDLGLPLLTVQQITDQQIDEEKLTENDDPEKGEHHAHH